MELPVCFFDSLWFVFYGCFFIFGLKSVSYSANKIDQHRLSKIINKIEVEKTVNTYI